MTDNPHTAISTALRTGVGCPSLRLYAFVDGDNLAVIYWPHYATSMKYVAVDLLNLGKRVFLAVPVDDYFPLHRYAVDLIAATFKSGPHLPPLNVLGGGYLGAVAGGVRCYGYSGDFGGGPHDLATPIFNKAFSGG